MKSEDWKEYKKLQSAAREANGKNAVQMLDKLDVDYRVHNGGYHLRVMHPESAEEIDFWPTRGRWRTENGKSYFGIMDLINYLGISDG
jgi:hypothetical protein